MILSLASLLNSCAGGGTAGSPAPSGVGVTFVASVTVTPQAATVPTGGSAQFVATVVNAPSTPMQWEVNHVPGGNGTMGTINSTGLYQAPVSVPSAPVEITAVVQADTKQFGSADVTVVAPVSVSPRRAALTTSQPQQFQAAGPAVGASGVIWSASGGTITADGLYTPPPGAGIFIVTATSLTNSTAGASATVYVTALAGQSSWRNDAGLTGQNRQELALNPTTLAAASFGKVSSCAVDGQVHAQPLYAANLFDGSRIRNVLYVATEHDSVYAFDADAIPCQLIWTRSFLDETVSGTAAPGGDIPGIGVAPEVGIAGTPVIDRASGTLYVVAKTKEIGLLGPSYVQRLHALDIVTGGEKLGGPVVIAATVSGAGDGSSGDLLRFDPLLQIQRGALLLAGNRLYVPFSRQAQTNLYHGWLLVYDATTLAPVGVFNSTPNGSQGGFAENGAGASADAAGNIFAATGRGSFNASLSVLSFAQTVIKLQPSPLAIANLTRDTFTPSDQATLTNNQNDLGSSGVLVVPDQIGATNPRLAVVGGTNGVLYLLNRDDLGGFVASGADRVVKTLDLAHAIYGTPAYWQNTLYVAAADAPLRAHALSAGTLADTPSSQSGSAISAPGASPTVSSNGGSGGIVWIVDTGGADSGAPAVLRAFDAADLTRELYNSSAKPEDAAGPAAKLATPSVANGKVYVGTQNEVTVYGLLP